MKDTEINFPCFTIESQPCFTAVKLQREVTHGDDVTARLPASGLTDAVCVRHAFPWHAVPPQALVHVIAGVTVLHPVVGCRGDNEEYVPHSGAEQPTSHEAVHPAKINT